MDFDLSTQINGVIKGINGFFGDFFLSDNKIGFQMSEINLKLPV